jgi:hypothetical protein
LIKNGADVTAREGKRTALDLARVEHRDDLIAMFERAMPADSKPAKAAARSVAATAHDRKMQRILAKNLAAAVPTRSRS